MDSEFIKSLGVVVSLLWVLERIINDIRTWRGGSPELRLIKQQLVGGNDRMYALLERILARLDGR